MTRGADLRLVRRFAVPPARIWEACTRPELLMQWFSPAPFHDCTVKADLRVGGRLFFRMTGPPGTFAAEGTYREVEAPRRLALTWTWVEAPPDGPPDRATSLVTFEIEPEGVGARLTLTHAGLSGQTSAESHGEGWTETLAKLEQLLKGGGET